MSAPSGQPRTPKSLWRAAAIITLVLPVGIIAAWLYTMLVGIQNEDLASIGKLSLGFILGTLATRVWGE